MHMYVYIYTDFYIGKNSRGYSLTQEASRHSPAYVCIYTRTTLHTCIWEVRQNVDFSLSLTQSCNGTSE